MDTKAYSAARKPQWQRLQTLSKTRQLSGDEADELARLYHATSRDLSVIRTSGPDPYTISSLSATIALARARLTATEVLPLRSVFEFFVATMPRALYRVRWWTVGTMVAFIAIAVSYGVAFYNSGELQAAAGSPSQLRHYAESAFTSYYTTYPAPDFATQVWTNNAWLAAVCVGGGVSGVLPIWVLYANATGVGQAGAIMHMHGYLDVFFIHILPHGMLELTAIFVAAGAGLRLFWALVAPGQRTRLQAVGEAGRTLSLVAVALVFVLGISGLIEGFVTGAQMPTWIKMTIGGLALVGYWLYTLTLGRIADRRGGSGDEDMDGYEQIEALSAAQREAALDNVRSVAAPTTYS